MRRRFAGAAAAASLIFVGCVCVALAGSAGVARHSDLAGRWPLDTLGGAGETPDASGHDAETRATAVDVIAGKFGNAFRFGSAASDVVASDRAGALEPQQLSIVAWVRRGGSPGTRRYVVAKNAIGCEASFYALYTGFTGGLVFYVFDGERAHFSPEAAPSIWDNSWHAVAGTYDGETVRLYVDAKEVGSGTPASVQIPYPTIRDGPLTLSLGTYPGGARCLTPYDWTGDLDELSVFSRALESNEIEYLHRAPGPAPRRLPLPAAPAPARPLGAPAGSGAVLVRRPGERAFSEMSGSEPLPVGTVVNATRGTIALTALAEAGSTTSATAWGGRFAIGAAYSIQIRSLQAASAVVRVTRLPMRPKLTCRRRGTAAAGAVIRRRLNIRAPRHFRVVGRYASVRPLGSARAQISVRDTCKATTIFVRTGRVEVFDLVRKRGRAVAARKTVVVRPRA